MYKKRNFYMSELGNKFQAHPKDKVLVVLVSFTCLKSSTSAIVTGFESSPTATDQSALLELNKTNN